MSFKDDNEKRINRLFSMGLWTWLRIVEKDMDKLSEGGQNALRLLREDLEKLTKENQDE